ncbi:MAG: hypothetical protein ACLTMP_04195 [Eggerthella lenta]
MKKHMSYIQAGDHGVPNWGFPRALRSSRRRWRRGSAASTRKCAV